MSYRRRLGLIVWEEAIGHLVRKTKNVICHLAEFLVSSCEFKSLVRVSKTLVPIAIESVKNSSEII